MSSAQQIERKPWPESCRLLVEELPRESWADHPHHTGLIRFWLSRHHGFRKKLHRLEQETQLHIEKMDDPAGFAHSMYQEAEYLVQGLKGHHQIEDHHFFPILKKLDARAREGFEILESDHVMVDRLLADFSLQTHTLLYDCGQREEFENHSVLLLQAIQKLKAYLHRHLDDEENIVVPVLLKYAPDGIR